LIHLNYLWAGLIFIVVIAQGCALAPQSSQRTSTPSKESAPSTVAPDEGPHTSPLMIPRPQQPEYMPQQQSKAASPASVPATHSTSSRNPVVVSLLESASQFESKGDLGRAAASVERGLRIAPKDAHLWLRLARIRLQQDRPQQAETLAKKSIRFAARDPSLLASSWRVRAEARGQQGDLSGAVEAREKAAQYQ